LLEINFGFHWEMTLGYFTLSILVDYYLNNTEVVIDK